ncbi:MAG: rhomboid family intramembrane serine protease [Pelobium sp.]
MYITTTILIILIFSFSLMANLNQRFYFSHLLYPYGIRSIKQCYPIVTSNFIHASYLHLVINLLLIYIFGNELERVLIEHDRYRIWVFFIWLGGSIAGSTTDFIINRQKEQFHGCGASNGAMALVAAYLSLDVDYFLKFYAALHLKHTFILALVIMATLYGLLRRVGRVNYRSHFVGILTGLLIAYLIKVISS